MQEHATKSPILVTHSEWHVCKSPPLRLQYMSPTKSDMCQTLISSGYNVFIIANQITVVGTGYGARPKGRSGFWRLFVRSRSKATRKGKMVFSWRFFTLNSPRLASSSLGLRENLSPKQATHLGKLMPSTLSKQLAWASFPCTKWLFL